MPLRSNLFSGDTRLEAAATTPSSHITRGARGEFVEKIQYAIATVAGIPLKVDGQYGPATAAAVLEFKKKQHIINPRYQTQPDDIVGVMTMAALDEALLAMQQSGKHARATRCRYHLNYSQSLKR